MSVFDTGSGSDAIKVVTGSYVGDGRSGQYNRKTLTFPGRPMLGVIMGDQDHTSALYFARPAIWAQLSGEVTGWSYTTWGENQVSFYDLAPEFMQNESGVTYTYTFICEV